MRGRWASRTAAFCLVLGAVVPSWGGEARAFADWQRDLRDRSPEVRARAAEALGRFGPGAVPLLTPALGDPEFTVRRAAAESLRAIGPAVVPSMIRALENSEVRIRANAAVVLGGLGPAAREAVPPLARMLKDANLRVRELAAEAIDKITSTDGSNWTVPLNCH